MNKAKPTIKKLTTQLDNARRFYAAGDYTQTAKVLRLFKADAETVLKEQQKDMVDEMKYHLQLRENLNELSREAVALSRELKSMRERGELPLSEVDGE